MAKIGIVDPNGLLRAGIASLLESLGFDDLVQAATTETLRAEHRGEASPPQLCLITLVSGSDFITHCIDDIHSINPQCRIVFLANVLDLDAMTQCFAAGADGFLLQNISREALGNSINLVVADGKVFPAELADLFPKLRELRADPASPLCDTDLSPREMEIAASLTRGDSNKAIARRLQITEATVKAHVKRILRKIHVENRTKAALWAAGKLSSLEITPQKTQRKRANKH